MLNPASQSALTLKREPTTDLPGHFLRKRIVMLPGDGRLSEDAMTEQWKPIKGWEGWYEVSDQGRIKRVMPASGTQPGRILKPKVDRDGYGCVLLNRKNNPTVKKIHQLVAEHFVGDRPSLSHGVNHKNGIKLDNSCSNLEWATTRENNQHAVANGLQALGEERRGTKVTALDVVAIRKMRNHGMRLREIGKLFGLSDAGVCIICTGKTWKHVTEVAPVQSSGNTSLVNVA